MDITEVAQRSGVPTFLVCAHTETVDQSALRGPGSPSRITTGPNGNLWFTEPFPFDNRIGRITPAGVITEFQLTSPGSPQDIVTGPEGNLWFTEFDGEHLSQITPDGVVTRMQRVRDGPSGIGRGADGSIWLTQLIGNKIGRFTLR